MAIDVKAEHFKAAERAVKHAQAVRKLHRRRTEKGSPQREADIQAALDIIRDAMTPIRSALGRFSYKKGASAHSERYEKCLEWSAALQSERRKLWKMQAKPTKEEVNGDYAA